MDIKNKIALRNGEQIPYAYAINPKYIGSENNNAQKNASKIFLSDDLNLIFIESNACFGYLKT